jgi:hypothetical protein
VKEEESKKDKRGERRLKRNLLTESTFDHIERKFSGKRRSVPGHVDFTGYQIKTAPDHISDVPSGAVLLAVGAYPLLAIGGHKPSGLAVPLETVKNEMFKVLFFPLRGIHENVFFLEIEMLVEKCT